MYLQRAFKNTEAHQSEWGEMSSGIVRNDILSQIC